MVEIKLLTPIEEVMDGMQKRFLRQLKRMDIRTVKDLLWHFPVRYEDRSEFLKISELKKDEETTIQGIVQSARTRYIPNRKLSVTDIRIADENGDTLVLSFFNQPYIANTLKEGKVANFSGKVSEYKGKLTLRSPVYELTEARGKEKETQHTGRLVPVYRETKGLTSRGLRFIIKPILDNLEELHEYIPSKILRELDLPDINKALRQIHFPDKETDAVNALKSFAFRDLFLLQLRNAEEKRRLREQKAHPVKYSDAELKKILSYLPFELTASQKKTLGEILNDIGGDYPMNRLLQGDVGSGKTIVAGIAALLAVKNGYQAVFMAPTEILARQHFQTLIKFFEEYEGGIALLISKETKVFYGEGLETKIKKSELVKKIRSGSVGIVVGTHAVIQKGVQFKNLAFAVVDEQHRFGVSQRASLVDHGSASNRRESALAPHFLSMSATPIPRTLTMTIFGNLDLSLINELPKGRKPITTKIVDPTNRDKAYRFIKEQIKFGRQAFVICPRIEDPIAEHRGTRAQLSSRQEAHSGASPELNLDGITSKQKLAWAVRAVKVEYEKLSKQIFPDLKVGMLHGKMKTMEKAGVMRAFAEGEINILVSTSVVEVGVDVQNATIMMIEGADRFGLSQLYQFRGRVGRGEHQSFCLLFTDSKSNAVQERLQSLVAAKNGFELAEMDLKLRGPGEFLGDAQTGMPDLALKALQNPELLKTAQNKAEGLLNEDQDFEHYPLLKKKLAQFKREIHLE